MKRNCSLWISAWLALALVAANPVSAGSSDASAVVRLSVVGTNDFHGALEARHAKVVGGRLVGGMGTIAAYFRAVQATNPDGLILLDGGDLYQGTLLSAASEGRAVIEFYNDLRYAAATIGNHDFDFGPVGYNSTPENPDEDPLGVLKQRLTQARFPFLAANIVDRETGVPPVWPNVKPFEVIERHGVRIGIIGLSSVDTPLTTHPTNVRKLEFHPLLPALRRVLPLVRKAGATVVILIVHAGVEVDEATGEVHGPLAKLVRALEPSEVDLVIGGHTHLPFADRIAGVPVLQSWPNGMSFTRAELVVDRATGKVIPKRTTLFDNTFYFRTDRNGEPVSFLGKPIRPVRSFDQKLKVFRRSIAHLQRIRLGHAAQDLSNQASLDSPVGNLVTDAMRAAEPGIQVAMYNSGGLRTSIPKGVVTFGRIYEVVPFDNSLVKVTLTGRQIREILEHGLSTRYGVMEISGIRVLIDLDAEAGKRCLSIQTEDGQDIRDDLLYVVGTNEFVLNGGDGYFTFARGQDVQHTHTLIRELVARYIKHVKTVAPQMGGRYQQTKKSTVGKDL
jgi:5'-nucleotidase